MNVCEVLTREFPVSKRILYTIYNLYTLTTNGLKIPCHMVV